MFLSVHDDDWERRCPIRDGVTAAADNRQHGEGNRVFNMKLIYWCETRWSDRETDRQTECNLVAAVVANKLKPQNEPQQGRRKRTNYRVAIVNHGGIMYIVSHWVTN